MTVTHNLFSVGELNVLVVDAQLSSEMKTINDINYGYVFLLPWGVRQHRSCRYATLADINYLKSVLNGNGYRIEKNAPNADALYTIFAPEAPVVVAPVAAPKKVVAPKKAPAAAPKKAVAPKKAPVAAPKKKVSGMRLSNR